MRRLALAFALTALAALPAMAQGTVRTHQGDTPVPTPPAPAPDVRDHRTQWDRTMTPGQPVQWAVRGVSSIKPNERYAIHNLRRTQLGQEAQLGFYNCGSSSVCYDSTRWDPNGGMFEFRRAPSPIDRGAITVDEYVAIYNTKTRRYLTGLGNWTEAPQYIWQMRGLRNEGDWMSFSLYNSEAYAGAYLVLMEQGVRGRNNCCSDLGLIKSPGRID